ncbi:MAG: O-antigen ligase family protein [Breznakibacter sp.]
MAFLLGINSLCGLLQQIGELPPAHPLFKMGGSFGNPGPYTNFIVILLPMTLIVLFSPKNFPKSLFYFCLIASFLAVLVVFVSLARTAWVSLGVIALLYWGYYTNRNTGVKRWFKSPIAKISGILLVVVFIVVTAWFLAGVKKDSASGRIFIWKLTSQMIQDKPWFGHGFDRFCYELNKYQATFFAEGSESTVEVSLADNSTFAFNEFLQIFSELGVVGLIMFVAIFFVALFSRPSNHVKENIFRGFLNRAAIAAIVGFLVCSLFSYPLHNLPVLISLYGFLAIISGNSLAFKRVFELQLAYRKTMTMSLLVLICFGYYQILSRYVSEREWNSIAHKKGQLSGFSLQKSFEDLLPIMAYNKYFEYNYGAELIVLGQYEQGISVLERTTRRLNDSNIYSYLGLGYLATQQYDKAEYCFLVASYTVPSKLYPLYNLVKVYKLKGNEQQAMLIAHRIIGMGEKVETDVGRKILREMRKYLETGVL